MRLQIYFFPLRGLRLNDALGETVLVEPLGFCSPSRGSRSVPKFGASLLLGMLDALLTPRLPGLRSVDMGESLKLVEA